MPLRAELRRTMDFHKVQITVNMARSNEALADTKAVRLAANIVADSRSLRDTNLDDLSPEVKAELRTAVRLLQETAFLKYESMQALKKDDVS